MMETKVRSASRILIVDDTPANIQTLAAVLQQKGYAISVATNGKQALDVLGKVRPDLILLDVMMPEMDGFETCDRIKKSPEWRDIPIIFLTAKTETTDIVKGFELGAVDYVAKPFNSHELLARVNTHLMIDRLRRENESLLLNILPAPIADRLKAGSEHIADAFADVTVLFADIVGFTKLSAGLSPEELVALLNDLFTDFDRIADARGLEKIKTIGDAYMAVAGLPVPRADHAACAAHMALDMLEAVDQFNVRSGHALQVRIGINSGAGVAGVIGKRKFIYDLWGDAVNIASRMESQGVAGRVQVTEATRHRLAEIFRLEERGTIDLKGTGPMTTWFLTGRSAAEPLR
jgi:class 3 adenylate cyclase